MESKEAMKKLGVALLFPTYKRALLYLGDGEPKSTEQLASHLGMTVNSCYKLIMLLRKHKVIAVQDWIRTGEQGTPTKLWGLGTVDAKPPQKKTPAERSKKWRVKKKQITNFDSLKAFHNPYQNP